MMESNPYFLNLGTYPCPASPGTCSKTKQTKRTTQQQRRQITFAKLYLSVYLFIFPSACTLKMHKVASFIGGAMGISVQVFANAIEKIPLSRSKIFYVFYSLIMTVLLSRFLLNLSLLTLSRLFSIFFCNQDLICMFYCLDLVCTSEIKEDI
jgi:hypothetical protein